MVKFNPRDLNQTACDGKERQSCRIEVVLTRWQGLTLAICLILSIIVALADWDAAWESLSKIQNIVFTDVAPYSQPVAKGSWEEHEMLHPSAMDARWWVIHTREMLKDGGWRVRQTKVDNAPEGREVHWSSLLLWLLGSLAWVRSLVSGGEAAGFVSWAAKVVGPLLFIILCGGFAWLVRRREGVVAGGFALLTLLTSYGVMRCFQPGEADHHGIVVIFLAVSVYLLGAALSSEKGASDRVKLFRLSGIFGGAGLWVSAATALPVLVGAGVGGLVACWFGRRSKFSPGVWMEWGLWGCLTSLGFYLLEYFPENMGLRLEVNHPCYSLSWLAGGWWMVRVCQLMKGDFFWRVKFFWVKAICASLGLFLPLVIIFWGGDRYFLVSNDFLFSLHQLYIHEFQSLPKLISFVGGSWLWVTYYFWAFMVLGCMICLLLFGGLSSGLMSRMAVVLVPALIMQGLSIYQVRWISAASALWCVGAIFLFTWGIGRFVDWVRWVGLIFGIISIFFSQLPQAVIRSQTALRWIGPPIAEEAGNTLIMRDLAHRLIRSSQGVVPTVLAGPNTSTDLAYFGGIRVLGTLYWENLPGLIKAAEIFTSRNEVEALEKIQEVGVTHILLPSWDNFIEEYSELVKKAGFGRGELAFFKDLLINDKIPSWLRPFAYPIPTDEGIDGKSVRIFAVLPEQSLYEAAYYKALYYWESQELEKGRQAAEEALKLRPGDYRALELLKLCGG